MSDDGAAVRVCDAHFDAAAQLFCALLCPNPTPLKPPPSTCAHTRTHECSVALNFGAPEDQQRPRLWLLKKRTHALCGAFVLRVARAPLCLMIDDDEDELQMQKKAYSESKHIWDYVLLVASAAVTGCEQAATHKQCRRHLPLVCDVGCTSPLLLGRVCVCVRNLFSLSHPKGRLVHAAGRVQPAKVPTHNAQTARLSLSQRKPPMALKKSMHNASLSIPKKR